MTWRWLEWDHQARKKTVEKYGEKIIPPDMNLQDWPITYGDLEPYYDKFEKTCGTSGKAGNLAGQKVDGGNIFEGPRKNDYPNPPMIASQGMVMFEKAARNLGYHPFPQPSSNASRDYVNPDGVAFGQCHYCGFCERFGCEANAKASPHFTVIPLAMRNPHFQLRTNSTVLKVNLTRPAKRPSALPILTHAGASSSNPRISLSFRRTRSGMCTSCFILESGSPMTPKGERALSVVITPISAAVGPLPSSKKIRS